MKTLAIALGIFVFGCMAYGVIVSFTGDKTNTNTAEAHYTQAVLVLEKEKADIKPAEINLCEAEGKLAGEKFLEVALNKLEATADQVAVWKEKRDRDCAVIVSVFK